MAKHEDLYQERLSNYRKNMPATEPINPGPLLFQFFEAIAGMGKRAQKRGTIALMVRDRKRDFKNEES